MKKENVGCCLVVCKQSKSGCNLSAKLLLFPTSIVSLDTLTMYHHIR